jgi:hypothetical protein
VGPLKKNKPVVNSLVVLSLTSFAMMRNEVIMAKMKIAQAQKIVSDSRYGADKKKEARKVLREAKKTGKLAPKKKAKTKSKRTAVVKSRRTIKSKRKVKVSPRKKPTKKKTSKKLKRKTRTKKIKKAKTTSKRSRSTSTTGKVKFYDVKTKKYVRIPRSDCKIKRNRTTRGGDRLIGNYKGRKLHTFVKRGFKL